LGSKIRVTGSTILAVAGLLCGCSILESQTYKLQSVDVPPEGTSVPIGSDDWPIVDVRFDGKGPFRMMLDTGSRTTWIESALALQLSTEVLGTARITDGVDGAGMVGSAIRLGSLSIGNAVFRDVRAATSPGAPGWPAHIRGLIGLETFRDVLLTIDFPRREIRFARGSLDPYEPGVIGYASQPSAWIRVPISIGSRDFQAILDTGAPVEVTLPKSWAERVTLLGPLRVQGRVQSVSAAFTMFAARPAGEVKVGPIVLPLSEIYFQDRMPVAILGTKALQRLVVTIDQRYHLIRIEQPFSAEIVVPIHR
jgi:predicted aspartyl protease